ncbi:hypothetical protein Dimus_016807 [Dionaea muscipula]
MTVDDGRDGESTAAKGAGDGFAASRRPIAMCASLFIFFTFSLFRVFADDRDYVSGERLAILRLLARPSPSSSTNKFFFLPLLPAIWWMDVVNGDLAEFCSSPLDLLLIKFLFKNGVKRVQST